MTISWDFAFLAAVAGLSFLLSVVLVLVFRHGIRLSRVENVLERLQGDGERLERAVREDMAASRRETGDALRQNREELNLAVQSLNSNLLAQMEQFRVRVDERLEASRTASQGQSEQLRLLVDGKLNQVQADARQGREEMGAHLNRHGEGQQEQFEVLGNLLKNQVETFTGQLSLQLTAFTQSSEQSLESIRKALDERLGQVQRDARDGRTEQADSLKNFGELLTGQLQRLMQGNTEALEILRRTVETQLAAIQTDNADKLEQMRQTVDEKLHNTLEQRLGESFKLVGERLEQVHKGLGEMQTLASGVGDLKKVLTNVKVRGTWGEVQLGNLLEQMLSPDQYAKNVAPWPGSSERVEFAIRLPGRDEAGGTVWLPIDAKFPVEDYQKMMDAQDLGDIASMEEAGRALENRIRVEARAIREKYLHPPHTTDFGLLFLPIEGLYAEVIRRPGLLDHLQRDCRVTVTGPTTLTAILNSLQMGFRTLAVEKRSGEVWQVLGAVKTEFGKFGDVLAKTRKKLDEASRTIEQAESRTRVIDRRLRTVEALPVEGPLDLSLDPPPPEE